MEDRLSQVHQKKQMAWVLLGGFSAKTSYSSLYLEDIMQHTAPNKNAEGMACDGSNETALCHH